MYVLKKSSYNEREKVWSGIERKPMYHADCSIGRIIYNALKNHSENICQINADDGRVVTNREMLNWSVQIAKQLKKRNLGPNDVIGIVSKTGTYQSAVAVEPLTMGESQTMAILCSSGTTGLPKAVCIANYYPVYIVDDTNLSSFIQHRTFPSDMVIFSLSGLDWFSGLQQMLISTVIGCTRIITNKSSSSEQLLELIDKYKINIISFGRYYVSEMVTHPLASPERFSSLRALIITGGWLSIETILKMKALVKSALVLYGYGSTEIGSISVGIMNDNSVGQLKPGRRCRILSDEGENLGINEIGELFIHSGYSKWVGYFGNPSETREIYDDQGWFHTGDIGYFDDHNNLYIIDRKKDILKCNGFHYWPNQIEEVIAQLPNIKEVCVVGIIDEGLGDAPAAMIVQVQGELLNEEKIKQHVAKVLHSDYLHLHGGVYIVDAIPKNNNGKALRREVKEAIKKLNEIKQADK